MMKIFIVSFIVITMILLVCNYVDIPCTVARNSASILISSIIWLPIALILYFLSLYKSQSTISQFTFIVAYLAVLFWFLNIAFTLSGCGNVDHSDTIKKVAVPMQEELEKFYTQNKRFPSTQERNEMLEKVGCKMVGNDCMHRRDRMKLSSSSPSYKFSYNISFYIEKSYCQIFLDNDGTISSFECGVLPCIRFKQ